MRVLLVRPSLNKKTTTVEKTKQEEKNTNQEERKMDVFKELMAMQKRLKEEAENDPSLHTNIDQLIANTQSMDLATIPNEEKSLYEIKEEEKSLNTVPNEEKSLYEIKRKKYVEYIDILYFKHL